MNSHKIGRIQILLSGLAFGGLGVFAKVAYHAGVPSIHVLTLRFTVASALLGLWIGVFRKADFKLSFSSVISGLALGAAGYAAFASCFFKSLETLDASITVLLLYLYPTVVTIGGALLLNEHPNQRQWLALPLSFLGLAMILNSPRIHLSDIGVLWGFGSAVLYAFYILASRKMLKNTSPFGFSFYVHVGAAVCLLIYCALAGEVSDLPNEFLKAPFALFGLALIPTVLAVTLFLLGLQKVTGHEASLLSTTEPLCGVALATLMLREPLNFTQLCGALVLGLSLILPHVKFKRLFDLN